MKTIQWLDVGPRPDNQQHGVLERVAPYPGRLSATRAVASLILLSTGTTAVMLFRHLRYMRGPSLPLTKRIPLFNNTTHNLNNLSFAFAQLLQLEKVELNNSSFWWQSYEKLRAKQKNLFFFLPRRSNFLLQRSKKLRKKLVKVKRFWKIIATPHSSPSGKRTQFSLK